MRHFRKSCMELLQKKKDSLFNHSAISKSWRVEDHKLQLGLHISAALY